MQFLRLMLGLRVVTVFCSAVLTLLFFGCFLDDVLCLFWKDEGSLRLVSTMGLDSLLLVGWGALVPLLAMILLSFIILMCHRLIFIAIYGSGWLRTCCIRRACCCHMGGCLAYYYWCRLLLYPPFVVGIRCDVPFVFEFVIIIINFYQ